MKRRIIALLLTGLLTACGGIPIRSIPQLLSLQQQLLDADPGEYLLAIQVDEHLVPPPDAVPILKLVIRPNEPAAFSAIDKNLPMQFDVAQANILGLPLPAKQRKWLIYRLTESSQNQLRGVQNDFKSLKTQKTGGTLSIGIDQEGIAVRDPKLADTRWESWLRTSRRDGFFELWSGTVADLLQLAKQAKTR